jgi:hypothetical protein
MVTLKAGSKSVRNATLTAPFRSGSAALADTGCKIET